MKFKVGDKVRVVRCRTHKNCKYINTIGKIIDIVADRCFPYELENCEEIFREDELELVQEKQFTKADLKGRDIVTCKNGTKRMVIKSYLIDGYGQRTDSLDNYNNKLERNDYDDLDIVKVERPVKYETVFERKEEVLDAAEKRYLSDVIRPFKNRVKYIYKGQEWSNKKEFINIILKEDTLDLPYFAAKTMYKGMELGRNYTLEELGL